MREAANASQLKRNFAGSRAAVRAGGVLGLLPQRRHGDGAHPRRADQRPGAAARVGHRHRAARRERRAHLLHPGVPPQFLPRRHAPGQHLRADRRSAAAALCGGGLRHRRHARSARPALPGGELPRGVRSRLPARRAAAPRVRLGARRHARRRDGVRGAHGVRADLRPAAEGHLLRADPAAAVRDLAALQHADPAAAHPAAEDAAERRGAGARSVSGAGHLEDRQPDPARVDARARQRARRCARAARPRAAADGGGAQHAGAAQALGARGRRRLRGCSRRRPQRPADGDARRRADPRRDASPSRRVDPRGGSCWLRARWCGWPCWAQPRRRDCGLRGVLAVGAAGRSSSGLWR